jgi:hypothetical protein
MMRAVLWALAAAALLTVACAGVPDPTAERGVITAPPTSTATAVGRTAAVPTVAFPDARLTPGAAFDATAQQVCTPGYSKSVRNVSTAEKDQVYRSYGITSDADGQYEVDHLIPLEIGGANDIRNLWPEPAEPRPGFHEKDKLEDALHALICNGSLDIHVAQQEVIHNWFASYQLRVLGIRPGSEAPAPVLSTPAASGTDVVTLTPSAAPGSVFYQNCTAARAAGAAPIYRGQPGYRAELDGDGDGIACE